NGPPAIHFDLIRPNSDEEVPKGTVSRAKAICPACGAVLSPNRVRAQLAAQRGGADVLFDEAGRRIGGARMMAVVTVRRGGGGRYYRLPTDADYNAVRLAQQRLAALLSDWKRTGESRLCPVPDEPLPPVWTLGFRVQKYGMLSWGDLFTARQKLALAVVTGLARRFAELDPVWWTQETGIREMSIKEVQACRERIDHTHLSFVPRPFVSCVRAANP